MTQGMAYQPSDVQQIFKNTGAQNWNDLAKFIRTKGNTVWHITEEEAKQMADDVEMLAQSGEKFTHDPNEVLSLVKKHKSHQSSQKGGGQQHSGQHMHHKSSSSESVFVKLLKAI